MSKILHLYKILASILTTVFYLSPISTDVKIDMKASYQLQTYDIRLLDS